MSEEKPGSTLSESFNQAAKLQSDGKLDEAAVLYRKVMATEPDNWRAFTNYGALMRKQERFAEAVAAQRRALNMRPDSQSVLNNLGNALLATGQFDDCLAVRTRLYEHEPLNPKWIRDYTMVLRLMGRHEEVIEIIDRAEEQLGLEGLSEARLQRGMSLLTLGRYKRGLVDFEARYLSEEVDLPENMPWPRWQGEDIAGKRILVVPEQGLGDAILMCRFLPRLKALGPEVVMLLRKPVFRLLEHVEGPDHVVMAARRKMRASYYIPNMSLPNLVGMDPGDLPPPAPKLTIPEDSRARARERVGPYKDYFKIGIVWNGLASYRGNNRRSTELGNFLRFVGVPGVQLFSLYKGEAHGELADSGAAGLIIDACGDDRDFADAAAIIDELDLCITTDTGVVHVAASLGKPVWNMLSYEGFWLYGTEETTPWYPSMRIFRQPKPNDWDSVFERVEAELRAMLGCPK